MTLQLRPRPTPFPRAGTLPTISSPYIKTRRILTIRPYIFFISLLFLLSCTSKSLSLFPRHSRTQPNEPTSNISSVSRNIVKLRPPTVLVIPTYGGIGNQIYFLLEALFLSRHANLHLVVPSLPSRKFPERPGVLSENPGDEFWDVDLLQQAVGPHGTVLTALPDVCNARFDTIYFATRSRPVGTRPALKVSSRLRQAACFQVRDFDWEDEVPPMNEWECEKRIFENSTLESRVLPLSLPPDRTFIEELKRLRRRPTGADHTTRPACVIVDGHAFNVGGKKGHEYLYSFMHYMEAAPSIKKLAANWTADNLAVLHLRYDERECVQKRENVNQVCVRVLLGAGQVGTVYWAYVGELVNVVVRAMTGEKLKRLFIAASPYVPTKTLANLKEAFRRRVVVVTGAEGVGESVVNFLERELAIRAKLFVGDFASTWSGTVYYKRRTMGRKTIWSSVLLGKGRQLGYYEEQLPIPKPEVYEKEFKYGSG